MPLALHEDSTAPPQRHSPARADREIVDRPATRPTPVNSFGDYELLEEIARGGMGVVYRARQRSLNRLVALKMILAGQLATLDDIERFRSEAQAAAALSHPGIVPIYEVGQVGGQHFFSMELIDGMSLSRRIAIGPLEAIEAAEILREVAEAVQFAHEHGIVHHDLKPANILVDFDGQPHVTDFGLARRINSECGPLSPRAEPPSVDVPSIALGESGRHSGEPIGTASYMPPEQAFGQRDQIGPHSDVYSLGATLYCLLTGRPPFQSANTADTLLQVIHHDPVPPRLFNSQIPKDLETICLKCLEKTPARRYGSAAVLGEELNRFLNSEPILARPIGPVGRLMKWCQRHRSLAVVAFVLAASVSTLVATSVIYNVQLVEQREAARRAEQNAVNLLKLTQDLLQQLGQVRESESALLTLQMTDYGGLSAELEQWAISPDDESNNERRVRLIDELQRLGDSAVPALRERLKQLHDQVTERDPILRRHISETVNQLNAACREAWQQTTEQSPIVRDRVQVLLQARVLQLCDDLLANSRHPNLDELRHRWLTFRHSLSIVADDKLITTMDDVAARLTTWTDRRPDAIEMPLRELQAKLRSAMSL